MIEAAQTPAPADKPPYKARVRKATNGQFHWRVTSGNSKSVAIGGETFVRQQGAADSFLKVAHTIRRMSEDQFAEFCKGVLAK